VFIGKVGNIKMLLKSFWIRVKLISRITSLFIPVKIFSKVFFDLLVFLIGGCPRLLDHILPNPYD
jgi:hypothetical protein